MKASRSKNMSRLKNGKVGGNWIMLPGINSKITNSLKYRAMPEIEDQENLSAKAHFSGQVQLSKNTNLTVKKVSSMEPHLTDQEKISAMCKHTGIDEIFANDFLVNSDWNLEKEFLPIIQKSFPAIKDFNDAVRDTFTEEISSDFPNKNNKPNKCLSRSNRAISVTNRHFVKVVHDGLNAIEGNRKETEFPCIQSSSTKSSFVLPDITIYGKELSCFIKDDLISAITLKNLYDSGRLNWWAELGTCRKLYPLSTVGDGNCLLHAVSLGMWGFHDRLFVLRKALHEMFLHPCANKAVYRRWKYNTWKENKICGGLAYSNDEWRNEWDSVIKQASERPKKYVSNSPTRRVSRALSFRRDSSGDNVIPNFYEGESLDSLEPIHIYMLANLLCRPIIVIAEEMLKDSEGRDIAPIPFGGIYIPIERNPDDCCKFPLVLAYDSSHFSALVPAKRENDVEGRKLVNTIPVQDRLRRILPIRFSIDPGKNWSLVHDDSLKNELPDLTFNEILIIMRKYLELVRVKIPGRSPKPPRRESRFAIKNVMLELSDVLIELPEPSEVLATQINMNEPPKYYNEMIQNYISHVKEKVKEQKLNRPKNDMQNPAAEPFENIEPTKISVEKKENLSHISSNLKSPSQSRSGETHLIDVSASSTQSKILPKSPRLKVKEFSEFRASNQDIKELLDGSQSNKETKVFSNKKCRSQGCRFYGSEVNAGFCSGCVPNHN